MPKLYDKHSGTLIGEITGEQLDFLNECLVEESDEDREYYLDGPVLEFLEEEGGDGALVAMLRKALGEREEMDLRWEP